MITVNQVSGGGGRGGSAPSDLCFFVLFCFVLFFSNKITESKNLPT